MQQSNFLKHKLEALINIARLAPSVHNAQPWLVRVFDPDTLEVTIDAAHALHEADPTGRQTTLSIGIFCEALCIAATSLGCSVDAVTFRHRSAKISLSATSVEVSAQHSVDLLRRRASDRSIFKPTIIPPAAATSIEASGSSKNTTATFITNRSLIQQIAELTGKGTALALRSPDFREELRGYLVLPWSNKKRGIAVRSLYIPWVAAILQPVLLHVGRGVKAEAKLEKQRWLSASGIAVILGNGDMPRHWFEAGRAYLRTSLAIEEAGLSQATSAAVVEASNYHEDIESLLGTNKRILAMIRVGKGSTRRRYSPRLDTASLITLR